MKRNVRIAGADVWVGKHVGSLHKKGRMCSFYPTLLSQVLDFYEPASRRTGIAGGPLN